jgi:hypothetical protein
MAGRRSSQPLRRSLVRSSLSTRSQLHDLSRAYELALPILRQAFAHAPPPQDQPQPTRRSRVPESLCGA